MSPINHNQKNSIQKPGLVPFRVNFSKPINGKMTAVLAEEQAKIILKEVERLHRGGVIKIGITYSANQAQAETIINNYAQNKWKNAINGANQAAVVCHIEHLLETDEYKHLQKIYHTIPIPTMKYDEGHIKPADDEMLLNCLNHADTFVKTGGVILGWTNQTTPAGQLAIGGGIAANAQPEEHKQQINEWVKKQLSKSSAIVKEQPIAMNDRTKIPEELPRSTPKINTNKASNDDTPSYSMMLLGGFISIVGIAAVALAFIVGNAVTGGGIALATAAFGSVMALSGVGLFRAASLSNNTPSQETVELDPKFWTVF